MGSEMCIRDSASEHREICNMDTAMMRKVLGSEVNLSACMLDGHAGCTFVVAHANHAGNGIALNNSALNNVVA